MPTAILYSILFSMSQGHSSLFLLLTLASAWACTSAAESSSQAEISNSADYRVVLSTEASWVEGEDWTVPAEPSMAMGVLDGAEEYQLVDVVAATRRSDGTLVVVDRGAQTVRLYDPDGTFLKTLGGPGSGPGEFTDPGPALVGAGDTVTVWDGALLRVTRFDSRGQLAGVSTVDWGKVTSRLGAGGETGGGGKQGAMGKGGGGEGLYPGPMVPLPDGGLLIRLVEKTAATPPSGYHRPQSGALLASPDLSVIDTLMFFHDGEQFIVDAPWGPFGVTPPLAKETRIAHQGSPLRVCIGDQEGPEIVCIGPDGVRTALRWVSAPGPPTAAEVEAWREATVQEYDLKLGRQQVLGMLDQVPLPESRPAYSQILLDPAGNLWAERGPYTPSDEARIDFLVFDPEGILLGTVALPPIKVLEIGLDYVLGIFQDELEVEYLHLYELRKPSVGAG